MEVQLINKNLFGHFYSTIGFYNNDINSHITYFFHHYIFTISPGYYSSVIKQTIAWYVSSIMNYLIVEAENI